jgi:sulfur relay protein TusC/DsrF
MKRLTILIKSPPFKTYLNEIQDLILAQSAFFNHLNVIFLREGIFHLLNNNSNQLNNNEKDSLNIYKTFALYDIETIYLSENDLEKYKITKKHLSIDCIIKNNLEIQSIIQTSDIVLNY